MLVRHEVSACACVFPRPFCAPKLLAIMRLIVETVLGTEAGRVVILMGFASCSRVSLTRLSLNTVFI